MSRQDNPHFAGEFYTRFKVFHELMSRKVREIMLVSSPYDAYILEEDGSLASRIINEYSGLNLSLPPRVKRVSSAVEALDLLSRRQFDLVITMPYLDDMTACTLGAEIKQIRPDLPVILLHHSPRSAADMRGIGCAGIDRQFVWTGNSDLLLALVKNAEDDLNVEMDTRRAMVPVLILVEDSPVYRSRFLPLIYTEIVRQTQSVLSAGLNEDHRLLLMRARPKILLAETYEEAVALYETYKEYLLGVMSDASFPRKGIQDPEAGIRFLSGIRDSVPDLPLLLLSSEPGNRSGAEGIPAEFLDKNDEKLHEEIRRFFLDHLGFGDFVFRMPDGRELRRASSLRYLVRVLPDIPDESVRYHADRNHFSRWIMSRSEVALASMIRAVQSGDFPDLEGLRSYIVDRVQALRRWQQRGVVTQFQRHQFDADIMEFTKIGNGSLGGKARGLAFMSALLQETPEIHERYPDVRIRIPRTLTISTDGFEAFVDENHLRDLVEGEREDDEVLTRFLSCPLPGWLMDDLQTFIGAVRYPLSVRSSSRMEDAHSQPYAGLYHTCMIPNNDPDDGIRLAQLASAVKRVYASTWYRSPKSFSRGTDNRHREESMAVIIQQLGGRAHGDWFYPDISGVAQSHNYYPVGPMTPDDGIAHIALGLGKTVVDGGLVLRFSPRYPSVMPQFSTTADMLENSQREFYALKIRDYPPELHFETDGNLTRREVFEAETEAPVRALASTYIPEEDRIRDSGYLPGPKIISFAAILKHQTVPLPGLLSDLLDLGRKAMGSPVEIEFSMNMPEQKKVPAEFLFLQMRPMVALREGGDVEITGADAEAAFCVGSQALGNGCLTDISDIVYVRPEAFDPARTKEAAAEVGRINARLVREKRPYLLIGPGRWGSADRWLGIPVEWRDISGVAAMVELRGAGVNADPSHGSHFFQNITSLGIHYVTVQMSAGEDGDDQSGDGNAGRGSGDWLDMDWLDACPVMAETEFLRHVRTESPILIKTDGKTARNIMLPPPSG